MYKNQRKFAWLLGLNVFTLIMPSALATPVLNYSASCEVSVFPPSTGYGADNCLSLNDSTSNAPLAGFSSASVSNSDDGYYSSANASAAYTFGVDFGRLGVAVMATAGGDAPSASPGGYAVAGTAHSTANISFFDEITPYSSSLTLGTPVSINYQVPIHFLITSALSTGSYVDYQFTVNWFLGGESGTYSGFGNSLIEESNIHYSGSFIGKVGEISNVFQQISLNANVADGAYFSADEYHSSSADVNMNFQNTVQLFLKAEDPNVALFSASGHDYAPLISSVPEPETYTMLISGLITLFWYRRRLVKHPNGIIIPTNCEVHCPDTIFTRCKI